eukprot:symbB.v1.2.009265.t2/scaffold566.1/size186494/6
MISAAMTEAQGQWRQELSVVKGEQRQQLGLLEEVAEAVRQSSARLEKVERTLTVHERNLRRSEEQLKAISKTEIPPWYAQLEGALVNLEREVNEQQVAVEVQVARLQVECDGLRRRSEVLGGMREEVLQAVEEKVFTAREPHVREDRSREGLLLKRCDDLDARLASQKVHVEAWDGIGTLNSYSIGRMSEMIQIHVLLPNGHAELFTLLPSSTVQDLKTKAERAFEKKYLRLITAKNQVLVHPDKTLEEAEIEDGERLTALVLQPQLAATRGAFALWCHGYNTIVTWGDGSFGGDSSALQDQIKGVQQIQATESAFAAILEDGSVITWGRENRGGDSSVVQDQLKGVQHIQATFRAFAAILADGSVVTWGASDGGGDCSAVKDQLKGVQQIQATPNGAFAAMLADGSVVTWGHASFGGDSSAVEDQLKGVQQIQATFAAFAAILGDGSVVTWGDPHSGGDSLAVQDQLRGVQQIQSTVLGAFAAILADGSVVTWGDPHSGGDSLAVQDQLRGVEQIQATSHAFAATREDCAEDSLAVEKKPRLG